MNLIEHALRYELLGWFVLPIHPTEKRPLVKWTDRKNNRPTPMEIKDWWQRWPTGPNWVATGSLSGIDVVDLDGPDAFEKCISLCGGLPDTVPAITRSTGGRPSPVFQTRKTRAEESGMRWARSANGWRHGRCCSKCPPVWEVATGGKE